MPRWHTRRCLLTSLSVAVIAVSWAVPPRRADAAGSNLTKPVDSVDRARLQLPRLGSTSNASGSPESEAYLFTGQSSGGGSGSSTSVVLLFEPGGTSELLAESPDEQLSYAGSWSYGSGRLSLAFSAPDFHPHATFAFDPSRSRVTMPFLVFGLGTGTSKWRQEDFDLNTSLRTVFDAAMAAATSPPSEADAIAAAYNYVKARLTPDRQPAQIRADHGRLRPQASNGLTCFNDCVATPPIASIQQEANGILVTYDDGVTMDIMLSSWASPGGEATTPLTPSSLASDPRVFLNEAAPGNGEDDPQNKTALVFAPFADIPFYSYLNDAGQPGYGYSAPSGFSDFSDFPKVEKELTGDGYKYEQLFDGAATLQALIEELTQAPGVVVIATHGAPDGFVATGSSLGSGNLTDSAIVANFISFEKQLRREGYGSLVTTRYALRPFEADMDAGTVGAYVGIGPGFWSWLEHSAHVSFEHSLVYMDACDTDQDAALRETIDARAYFAWNAPVGMGVAGGVLQYLVASLSRNTHSAEEAYYNLVRVAKTGQEIYEEDHILNNLDRWVIPSELDAYGSDSTIIVPYVGNGWQDPKDNSGQIWWLLYAARWSHDSQTGAANIESCYSRLWSHGKLGGLGNQFCQNANTGTPPTGPEVSYAVYLLTGRLGGAFNGMAVPRFTLHDGA